MYKILIDVVFKPFGRAMLLGLLDHLPNNLRVYDNQPKKF